MIFSIHIINVTRWVFIFGLFTIVWDLIDNIKEGDETFSLCNIFSYVFIFIPCVVVNQFILDIWATIITILFLYSLIEFVNPYKFSTWLPHALKSVILFNLTVAIKGFESIWRIINNIHSLYLLIAPFGKYLFIGIAITAVVTEVLYYIRGKYKLDSDE